MSDNNTPSYQQSPSNSQGGNPAWNPLLEYVPEDARANVQPILQDWDKGVQERFNSLHERYRPYDHIVSQGVDPSVIDQSLNLMNQLNDNDGALEVYTALEAHLREQGLLGTETVETQATSGDTDQYGNQISALNDNFATLAEYVLAQTQQQEAAEQAAYEDAILEQELERASKEYGHFDRDEVLMRLANSADEDITVDDAVQDYLEMLVRHNVKPAPRVMGSEGFSGFPSQAPVDPRTFNREQTVDYLADYLNALNNQR